MMSVLMELIIAVQTELTLFAIAFGLHYVVFRGYKANRPKNLGKKFVSDEDSTADLQQSSHQPRPHLQQPSQDSTAPPLSSCCSEASERSSRVTTELSCGFGHH